MDKMMENREIKFRGMDVKGNWYTGNLAIISKKIKSIIEPGTYISNSVGMPFAYQVRPETVGQYTGLKDKDGKGKDIYFDDLMSNNFGTDKEVIRKIIMHKGTMMMERIKGKSTLPKLIPLYEWYKLNFKIIGNIYENPELIKE